MSLRRTCLVVFASALLLVPSLARADFLFWTASDGIYRATATGSGVTRIVDTSGRDARGIAVDPTSGFVYWTEFATSDIWRSDMNGGGQTRLVDMSNFGPNGIDIDPANNRMAWSTGNNLLRDDLSPATAQNPQGVVSGGTSSNGVAIDAANGHIYWSSLSSGLIRRINFDGTGLETVVSLGFPAYDVALDLVNGFVYWTEPRLQRIGKADLDPLTNDAATVVSGTNLAAANGLTLDIANDRLYWINDNVTNAGSTIFTSTLSGANAQPLLSTGASINANFIAFAPTPAAVPEPSSALLLAAVGLGAVAVRRCRRRGENRPANV